MRKTLSVIQRVLRKKRDIYEELLIHLQISRDYLMEEEGLTPEKAEEKAMQLFGLEGEIGSQVQQALFPYRKELMLTLAISSILFTIGVYLSSLFVEGNVLYRLALYFYEFKYNAVTSSTKSTFSY